jgi:UDP-2,3-diacylglucosamine hydrolase
MSTIAFVSDLHLFASRSSADSHFDAIVQAARISDHCVLGGDIFDFRWSIYPSAEATAEAAMKWLETFLEHTPGCSVHFLLGNHDDHPLLHERLPRLAAPENHFDWNRFYLRLGDTLFLHGDVADRTVTAAGLEEQRNQFHHGSRSPLQHRLYKMAVQAHLHRLAPPAVYPKKRVARRILSYMEHIGQGPETGVSHVCFGHTHRPVDNYHLGNVTFHNCGAPIGSAKFRIVRREVVIPEPESAGHPA